MHVEDGSGQTQAIDVVIDTGFSSFMSLPPATVASLGLPWMVRENTQLADGRSVLVDVYSAVVIWNGHPRKVKVQALGVHSLIGMAMLASHDLNMRVTDGGSVRIDALP
ncbi:MAG: clan AA aspartic protease [Planctomycetes bacterium]|nr:clan AA aspartic protease [Planctomycetota bacterium]